MWYKKLVINRYVWNGHTEFLVLIKRVASLSTKLNLIIFEWSYLNSTVLVYFLLNNKPFSFNDYCTILWNLLEIFLFNDKYTFLEVKSTILFY